MADHRPRDEDLLRAVAGEVGEGQSCPEPDRLAGYVTDGLVPDERSAVEQHLSRCPSCTGVVADLVSEADVMEEPSGTPTGSPLARTARREPWVLAAAAAVLVATLLWTVFRSAPTAPPTLADTAAALREAHGDTLADLEPLSPSELARAPDGAERGGVALHSPLGVELSTRPAFRFAAQPGVDHYTISLSTDAGEVLWTRTAGPTELDYPDSEKDLQRGSGYLWAVSFDRLGTQTARAAFRVADDAEATGFAAAIEALDGAPRSRLLAAHLAVRREHWSRARALAAQALAANPDGEIERETLAYVLAALGEEGEEE